MSNPKVSTKNTKTEILEAYEELAKQVNDQSLPIISNTENKVKEKITKELDSNSPEKIVDSLGKLKVQINSTISTLLDQMVTESEKLSTLKKEIEKSSEDLEQIQKIKFEADTLKNLIQTRIEEEQKTKIDFQIFKENIDSQKQKELQRTKEETEDAKKKQSRELEEYEYDLKQKRKIEEEQYKTKKQKEEEIISQKQNDLDSKANEFKELQEKVAKFDSILEKEIAKTKSETIKEVTRELETKYNLEMKEIEGEKKVAEITIKNLDLTIKSQSEEIITLKSQLVEATKQIKDIAVSVIEGKGNQNLNQNKNSTEEIKKD